MAKQRAESMLLTHLIRRLRGLYDHAAPRRRVATLGALASGGQSGVDQAVLDFAVRRGVPYTGWCPSDGAAASGLRPGQTLFDKYPRLKAASTEDPAERTILNVWDSDATLILYRGDARDSAGTALTKHTAEVMNRPVLAVRMTDAPTPEETEAQLASLRKLVRHLPRSYTLNVAGPREEESVGIGRRTTAWLERMIEPLRAPVRSPEPPHP